MTDLKGQFDRALMAFEPAGDALKQTMDLVERRRRRRRVRGQSISALVVVLALLAILTPVLHSNGKNSQRVVPESPVSGMAIVAAKHDGAIQLLSARGTVLRTLVVPGTGVAKWGEPVSITVSEAENAVYIGYEILSPTHYSARIERVSLDGGSPVFVADGAKPAVSPDGTRLAYIQESSGTCQASALCPPSDLNLPLIIRDLTTGSEDELPSPVSVGVSALSWSDDDVHLAVSDGNGFWVVDTSTAATAKNPLAIFPPANSTSYWSLAAYRGSLGSIGAVALCPETIGCDQNTEVLSIDPTTQHAMLLARLDFGTSSLTFDSTGRTFAYVGLAPGTAVPSPLYIKSCAAAVLCMGTTGSTHLIPVDTLLIWHNGATTKLGTGYVSVALSGTGPRVPATRHKAQPVLFTHVAPDGSRVVARVVSVASSNCAIATTSDCGAPARSGTPGVEFDYTVSGLHYREVVADSDPRILDPQAGIMAPLFGANDPNQPKTDARLIILYVRAQVAEVRLAPSGPGGAAPEGDQMAPVDGWVAIPVHNTVNLARPEAFDAKGKLLGTALPFPCC
jgi:hypothetical protein